MAMTSSTWPRVVALLVVAFGAAGCAPAEPSSWWAATRRSQQVKKGNLTKAEERKIDRKADRILKD